MGHTCRVRGTWQQTGETCGSRVSPIPPVQVLQVNKGYCPLTSGSTWPDQDRSSSFRPRQHQPETGLRDGEYLGGSLRRCPIDGERIVSAPKKSNEYLPQTNPKLASFPEEKPFYCWQAIHWFRFRHNMSKKSVYDWIICSDDFQQADSPRPSKRIRYWWNIQAFRASMETRFSLGKKSPALCPKNLPHSDVIIGSWALKSWWNLGLAQADRKSPKSTIT